MTPQERQLIQALFERVRAAEGAPRDREAEALIAERLREAPHAPYTLAQAVLVMEQALAAADRRIAELEAELSGPEPAPGQGGFLDQSFGAPARSGGPNWSRSGAVPAAGPTAGPWGAHSAPAEPQPYAASQPYGQQAYGRPQGYGQQAYAQPQPAQGGSFLSGALSTAAGVAGGMMLANSLQGLWRSGASQPQPQPQAALSGDAAQTPASGADGLPPLDRGFGDIWPSGGPSSGAQPAGLADLSDPSDGFGGGDFETDV